MNGKKMTAAERFAEMGERFRKDGKFQIEEAKVELSEQIFILMEDKEVTEAELARRLGTSRAYINKVLQGSTNFTIESLVKIGMALECELKMEFVETRKVRDILDDDIIYIEAEKPIADPRVVSKSYKKENVVNIADFRPGNTGLKLEKNDATVQNAA